MMKHLIIFLFCFVIFFVVVFFFVLFCFVFPVIEFLHRIVDIFTEYFSECNKQRIKDHYVIVYEVMIL